jgi:DNA (cytosine-5)-methyltransferase 1
MRKLRFADLFCGAGGTSHGAVRSGVADAVFALNHWERAIATHSLNHAGAKHVNARLDMTNPSECPPIDLLFASPECTHHANARGSKPMNDQRRAGAWDVLKWVEHHRPSYVVIENVREFQRWGPLDKHGRPLKSLEGKFFDAWIMALRAAGYRVEHHLLNAADFGAPTSRLRLFVIARKGNRSPVFPEPTHCRTGLPNLLSSLPKWRSAAEVIDWSVPIASIFHRSKPLKDKTLRRIEIGLRKFVQPFVVKFRGEECGEPLQSPLSTVTAGGRHHGLAIPFQMSQCSGGVPRSLDKPAPTLLTAGAPSLTVPYLVNVSHGDSVESSSECRVRSPHKPMWTITTVQSEAIAIPFLSSYYGTGDAQSIAEPLDTITTKDRHSLIVAKHGQINTDLYGDSPAMVSLLATMAELGVADIFFRMFVNHELALAQGFDPSYQFTGTKKDITCQIGNSVSPPVAEHITLALAG